MYLHPFSFLMTFLDYKMEMSRGTITASKKTYTMLLYFYIYV